MLGMVQLLSILAMSSEFGQMDIQEEELPEVEVLPPMLKAAPILSMAESTFSCR